MNHVHHWVLETPNGPTSPGRCKLCGAEKLHGNTLPMDRAPQPAGSGSRKRKSARERWGDLALEPRELRAG